MKISTRITRLKDKIQKARQEITVIQDACPHHRLVGKFYSDTGNYCSSDDSYWVELECPECQKFWRTDQANVELIDGEYYTSSGYKFVHQ